MHTKRKGRRKNTMTAGGGGRNTAESRGSRASRASSGSSGIGKYAMNRSGIITLGWEGYRFVGDRFAVD